MMALQGAPALLAKLEAKKQQYNDRCEAAATAGALLVENAAKDKAPYKTGTLKRSITHETIEKSEKACHVSVGTNLEYARLQEYGGTIEGKPLLVFEIGGETIFVQSVTVPASPYLRPAFDETKKGVVEEVKRIFAGE